MKILIFNIGSATIKYKFINNNISLERKYYYKNKEDLLKKINKILELKPEIIIHRVVHGGNLKNCIITEKIIKKIENFSEFAPLHNPMQIKVIKFCKEKAKQIAIFDTSFFLSMPKIAKTYAIPKKIANKYQIRRYGFHGINHKYMRTKLKEKKLITCHLGAGSSVTAWLDKKPLDTSMGLTPLEGVMMATRSGSVDPSLVKYLEKKLKTKSIIDLLNKKSGFLGLTGTKNVELIVKKRKQEKYKLAFELFCYQIAKQISAYISTLKGIDAIAFSGGIGEDSWPTREKICSYLLWLNLKINSKKNKEHKYLISNNSKIKAYIIKANEFDIMLKETKKLI